MTSAQQNPTVTTLYSTRAHVFQIDPVTKNRWLSKADQAIPVSFVASYVTRNSPQSKTHSVKATKHDLKLIGINDVGEVLLDDLITPKTTFSKRAQKFCQWLDNNGAIFGLGFEQDADLDNFIERFEDLKRDMLLSAQLNQSKPQNAQQVSQATPISQQAERTPLTTSNQSPDVSNGHTQQSSNNYHQSRQHSNQNNNGNFSNKSGPQQVQSAMWTPQYPSANNSGDATSSLQNGAADQNGYNNATSSRYSRSQSMFSLPQGNRVNGHEPVKGSPDEPDNNWASNDQMRCEFEKLKQLQEKNKQTLSIWANELAILRTNNHKLTQALHDSKSHVIDWERELTSLREENKLLKTRVAQLESQKPESDHKKDLEKFKLYVDGMESKMRDKDKEIEELQNAMGDLELNMKRMHDNNNDEMTLNKHSLQQVQKLDQVGAKFDAIINELRGAKKEFAKIVEDMSSGQ